MDEPSLGEVYRLQQSLAGALERLTGEVRDRHHQLANQMNVVLAPISELKVRTERCEADINGLGVKLDEVRIYSAKIAGFSGLAAMIGGALLAWLINILKH